MVTDYPFSLNLPTVIYVVYINDKIKCLFLNDNCMVMEMRDKVIFLMFGVRRINNTALK